MKRILFLISSLEGGGAEKVLTTISNKLVDDYDITIMTIYNEGVYIKSLSHKISYKSFIQRPTRNKKRVMYRLLKYLPAGLLHKTIIKEKYDIEIGFLEGICTKIISAADKNTKKIGWIHTNIEKIPKKYWEFVNKAAAQKCYNMLDLVVCVSEDAKYAYSKIVQPEKEAVVMYNPIDVDDIISKSKEDNEIIKKEKFTMCAIGRFVYQKGFERLIDSAVRLKNEGYIFELSIIGDGALYKPLLVRINDLHINENIYLTGYKENVYPYLANSDLYICSSRTEGYSLTVAEALVLGVPVISTRCTGPIELLDNGKYGLLVDNSEKGIYEGLKAVMDDKELYMNLKEKSQIRGQKFNLELTINQVKEIIG